MVSAGKSVALIVRSVPYRQRSARAQIDVALAAAALERPLNVFFVGAAALQLLAARDTGTACLPVGYRAWGSLAELTDARVFVEPLWLEYLRRQAGSLPLVPEPMDADLMRDGWRGCDTVLVL